MKVIHIKITSENNIACIIHFKHYKLYHIRIIIVPMNQ